MPLASYSGWTSDEFFLQPQEFVLEEVEEGHIDPPPPPDRPRPGIRLGAVTTAGNARLVLVGNAFSTKAGEFLPADDAPVIDGQHRLGGLSGLIGGLIPVVANGWRAPARQHTSDNSSHHASFAPRHDMVALEPDPGQRRSAFEHPITDDFDAYLHANPAFCDGLLKRPEIHKKWISGLPRPRPFLGLH